MWLVFAVTSEKWRIVMWETLSCLDRKLSVTFLWINHVWGRHLQVFGPSWSEIPTVYVQVCELLADTHLDWDCTCCVFKWEEAAQISLSKDDACKGCGGSLYHHVWHHFLKFSKILLPHICFWFWLNCSFYLDRTGQEEVIVEKNERETRLWLSDLTLTVYLDPESAAWWPGRRPSGHFNLLWLKTGLNQNTRTNISW